MSPSFTPSKSRIALSATRDRRTVRKPQVRAESGTSPRPCARETRRGRNRTRDCQIRRLAQSYWSARRYACRGRSPKAARGKACRRHAPRSRYRSSRARSSRRSQAAEPPRFSVGKLLFVHVCSIILNRTKVILVAAAGCAQAGRHPASARSEERPARKLRRESSRRLPDVCP